ncbi:MAG: pentapeptide repeat-containing protein [Gemmatimonadales bacterium]
MPPRPTTPLDSLLPSVLGLSTAILAANPAYLPVALVATHPESLKAGLDWLSGIFGNLASDRWARGRAPRLPTGEELAQNHDLQRLAAAALSAALNALAVDPAMYWTPEERAALRSFAAIAPDDLETVQAGDVGPALDAGEVLAHVGRLAEDSSGVAPRVPDGLMAVWTLVIDRRLPALARDGAHFPGDVRRLAARLDTAYWFHVRELLKHDTEDGQFGGRAYRALGIEATAMLLLLARETKASIAGLSSDAETRHAETGQAFERVLAAIRAQPEPMIAALTEQIGRAEERTAAALASQRTLFESLGGGLDHLLAKLGRLSADLSDEVSRRTRLELPPMALAVFDFLVATGHRFARGHDRPVRNPDGSTDLRVAAGPEGAAWYCCIEGLVADHHVDRLHGRAEDAGAPTVLVTPHRTLDGVPAYAAARGIRIVTFRELVLQLLGLYSYGEYLARRATERVAHEAWFVSPRYSIAGAADSLEHLVSTGLESFIDDWLTDPTPDPIVVLGDFGTGKSTLLTRVARHRFRELKRPGDRIPVLIRVADRPAITSFADCLDEFGRRAGTRLAEPEVFEKLAQLGRLVVIFDGLDELVLNGVGDARAGFQAVAAGAGSRTKVLLSCRTNEFEDSAHERGVAGQPGLSEDLRAFWRVRLEPFDPADVASYLNRRLPPEEATEVAALLTDVYDLMDLARQPVLLEMIVSNWAAIREEAERLDGGKLEVGDLYRIYTGRWFQEAERPDAVLTSGERADLMVAAAVWLHEEDRAELSKSDLATLLRSALGRFGANPLIQRELRLQSFLVRNADDGYYFAHRSFQEYFLSLKVAREIGAETPELLAKATLRPEIVQFVSVHDPSLEQAWSMLERSARQSDSAILNGNLLSVLRDLDPTVFSGRDLGGLHATGADLRGARFVRTSLDDAVLTSCNIRDADFTEASLRRARLVKLNLGVRSAAKCVRFERDGMAVVSGNGKNGVVRLRVAGGSPELVHAHAGSVTSVSAEAGGIVASGAFDGRVRLSDPAVGESRELTLHGAIVYGVAVRPGGRHVASVDSAGQLRIWDRKHHDVVFDKKAHNGTGYTVEWSGCGTLLAIGSFDQTVSVWRFVDELGVRLEADPLVLADHDDLVNGVRFSPSGEVLAAASNNGSVRVWSLASGNVVAHLRAQAMPRAIEWAVAFSPDGETLASAGADGLVRLWDWRAGTHRSFTAHDNEVWSVDFDPTGTLIATGSLDQRVRIWRVSDGAQLGEWLFAAPDDGLMMTRADLRGADIPSALQRRVMQQLGGIVDDVE